MLLKVYYHYNFVLFDTKFDNKHIEAKYFKSLVDKKCYDDEVRLRELIVSWMLRHHEYHDFHE